jgi:predicted small lipoprotein YifL
MNRLLLIVALGLAVSACGVKSDLMKPDGTATPKTQNDPSKPPYPLGR